MTSRVEILRMIAKSILKDVETAQVLDDGPLPCVAIEMDDGEEFFVTVERA